MINFKQKKLFIGVIVGLVFSFGLGAIADETIFSVGDTNWLWFTENDNRDIRGNVLAPLEGQNIANMEYVQAATISDGGSGIVCVAGDLEVDPTGTSNNSYNGYIWCCVPDELGTGMNCIMGDGISPDHKYTWADNTYRNTIDGN